LPVYQGRFGTQQAERLLWRAGFGPRPGEAGKLARKGLKDAVRSLTRPRGKPRLVGPEPHDEDGLPLAPADAYGHDHLWWLDRMVRTNQPLVERMALSWHDWFATADVGHTQLNLNQNDLFRRMGLGRFDELLHGVTADPAMLVWLSGNENTRRHPNENYARELMELFTLGAGAGYTETDVREQARALTGWTNDWDDNIGAVNFRFEPKSWDAGPKTIFGHTGVFNWQDACNLCLEHPAHADYFVRKLWSYFIPKDVPKKSLGPLIARYRNGYSIRPVVESILMHPLFYEGPRMVKPPVVQIAGMLRAKKSGIWTEDFVWISADAGQLLFDPPNVSGWDEQRWLDTARIGGRWSAAARLTEQFEVIEDGYPVKETPKEAVAKAWRFWGKPTLSKRTEMELQQFANRVEGIITEEWHERSYRALRQNALRILIATSPDFTTA